MKKIIKITALLIFMLPILFFVAYILQSQMMKKSFIGFYGLENVKEDEKPYAFQRCNMNLLKPEFVYVTGKSMALISFYKPSRIFSQTDEEWNNSRIGGTKVENTTFPELVAMVKEDCEQFKKPYGDYRDETINWSYGKHEPEPELAPWQIEQKEQYEFQRMVEDIRYILKKHYTDEEMKETIEEYGEWKDLSDEELVRWYEEGPGKVPEGWKQR